MVVVMKNICKIIVIGVCMVLIIIGGKITVEINEPIATDLREETMYPVDEWTSVSTDDRHIKRRIDITNYQGSEGAIWVQVINEKGEVIVEPQIVDVGHGKILTREWDLSSNSHIVQVRAVEKGAKYKLGILHTLNKSIFG